MKGYSKTVLHPLIVLYAAALISSCSQGYEIKIGLNEGIVTFTLYEKNWVGKTVRAEDACVTYARLIAVASDQNYWEFASTGQQPCLPSHFRYGETPIGAKLSTPPRPLSNGAEYRLLISTAGGAGGIIFTAP